MQISGLKKNVTTHGKKIEILRLFIDKSCIDFHGYELRLVSMEK